MRANRYVSYLAAEIEPQALANARTFEREIEKTLDRIGQRSSQGSSAFANAALGTGVTRNLSNISTASLRTKRDLEALDIAQLKVGRGAQFMGQAFSRGADALQIVQGPLGPLAGRLSALGQVLRSLGGFTLAGVLGGGGAFALGSIATQYQKAHDTLSPFIADQKELNHAMNDVVSIATRTHQALQPVAELYATFTRVGQGLGLSQQRIGRLTETVSKASRIGGGDPEAQRGAIIQFGQALSANFHGSGQELQSILEQTPVLAKAIADGLGTTSGKLKQLAKDGQLSSDIVIKALERSSDLIDEEAARQPRRIGKSLQDLSNSAAVFVGRMDEATGATTGVANAIGFVADHMRGIVVLAGATAAAFSGRMFAGAIQGAQQYVSNLVTVGQLTNEQTRFNGIVKAALAEQAAQAVQTAEAEVAGAREYQAQIQANILLIEKQIAVQARALEMARTLDAGMRTSGGTGSSAALIASYEELQTSERALIATQQQLLASDAELAAAEDRLAVTTQALVVADEELVVADTAAAAATGRLAIAKGLLQAGVGRVQNALGALVGFMGGPMGVAFAAATTWALILASQTDHAKEAIDRFAGGEEGLLAKLENTTGKMREQAGAALTLARALRQATLAKSEQSVRDVGNQLGSDLYAASTKVPIGSQDFRTLRRLGGQAQANEFMPTRDIAALQEIMKRRPDAFKGDILQTVLGVNSGDAIKDVEGLTAAMIDLNDQRKQLADFDKRQTDKLAPLLGGGTGKPTKKSTLNAEAKLLAAQDPLSRARAELQVAEQAGPKADETSDDYKTRIAGLIQNVNSLVAARKAEKAATAAQRKEQAAYNKELHAEEKGRDNQAKLSNILDQYSDDSPIKRINQLRDAAARAKRQIDDLVGERVGEKTIFSKADAAAAKAQIDAYEKAQEHSEPVQKSLDLKQQELNVDRLISKGLGDQAEFLRRKVELEKEYGPLTKDEEQTIRDQIAQQHQINDALEKRNAIIENNARALDGFRDALQSSLSEVLQGNIKGGVGGFFKSIQKTFADAKAQEIVTKLIGDPGKKYRDEMTRGLNDSATKLDTSGDKLTAAAGALTDAAGVLSGHTPAGVAGVAGGQTGAPSTAGIVAKLLGPEFANLAGGLAAATSAIIGTGRDVRHSAESTQDAIVVTGRRLQQGTQPGNVESAINDLGKTIFGKDSKISKGIGQALEGAQTGAEVAGVAHLVGYKKFSTVGAEVGGGIGQVAGTAIGGPVGGKIGSIIGSILGGIVGGLFTKSNFARQNISGSGGVITATPGGDDHGAEQKKAAQDMADTFKNSLSQIASQLGATIGDFKVSVGVDKSGKYVVDPTGAGWISNRAGGPNVQQYDNPTDAVTAALVDAINDGAIKGISEGAKRLLKSGQDLTVALDKALQFQSVFTDLKKLKDPVGGAIDDLNAHFQQLISIFTEAGASAEEWSQLQQLYDLQRADAIKQATSATVSALGDFIQSITSSSESPLSKRTVYTNAQAEVNKYRADIAAGKAVDQDALVKALNNFEQASQALNGSRGGFYSDFQDILALANKAKENATGAAASTPTSPLPPSPFDAAGPWKALVAGNNTTNDILGQIRDILGNTGSGGGGGGSSINDLPYYGGAGGSSGYDTYAKFFTDGVGTPV